MAHVLGKGEEVVKPETRWACGRRFVLTSPVPGVKGHMDRCEEDSRKNGSVRQYILKRVLLTGREDATWQRDLDTWSQLLHLHILQYKDAWVTQSVQHVLCESARMSLSLCLSDMAPDKPSQSLYSTWLYHLASALEYMHERNGGARPILHRDVQPDNLLVTDHCLLKLCAFGSSKRMESARSKTGTQVGGGLFQSPEIASGKPYNHLTDIWSLGVTAVYIADYAKAGKVGSKEKLLSIMEGSGQAGAVLDVVRAALGDQATRPPASQIVRCLLQRLGDVIRSPPPRADYPRPLRRLLRKAKAKAGKKLPAKADVTAPTQTYIDVTHRVPTESNATSQALRESDVTSQVSDESFVTSRVSTQSDVISQVSTQSDVTFQVSTQSDVTSQISTQSDVTSRVSAHSDRVSTESDVTTGISTHSDVKSRVSVHNDVTFRVSVHSDCISRVSTESDITLEVSSHTDVTSRISKESDITPRASAHSDRTSRISTESDVTSQVSTESSITSHVPTTPTVALKETAWFPAERTEVLQSAAVLRKIATSIVSARQRKKRPPASGRRQDGQQGRTQGQQGRQVKGSTDTDHAHATTSPH